MLGKDKLACTAKLPGIHFDLFGTAPSFDQLAEARRDTKFNLQVFKHREHKFILACVSILLFVCAAISAAWLGDLIAGDVAAAAAAAVSIAVTFAGVSIGMSQSMSAGVYAVVYAAASASAFAGVITFANAITFAGGGAAASVGMIVVVGVIAGAIAGDYLFNRWIVGPRGQANDLLADLVEIEVSYQPGQCIEFAHWGESDKTVLAYQRQIAAQGRKPVMAEYSMAKAWMKSSAQRLNDQEKIEKARSLVPAGGKC